MFPWNFLIKKMYRKDLSISLNQTSYPGMDGSWLTERDLNIQPCRVYKFINCATKMLNIWMHIS